ncbi:extracellular solute-binding protein [Oceanibacterium hippocampi]|uniref:Oligopeptide-binding protein AppA n=1 Tax=Oceanibacterium hippocampi TaxID=745714 RepID=A0A1Y5RXE5_9PROT|nr:extracellular solute-binding protein [Oceanibacterium hippocampi]SLN25204.1 Oligopeptide-binding protein AppA precursor [Oceanibacterium hippocampi]
MFRSASLLAAILALQGMLGAPAMAEPRHALSLLGEPKYAADFSHLDYANPDAPKGGSLRLSAIGGFDSFNPFIVRGNVAAGVGLTVDSLMEQTMDDASAEYGLIAESIEVAPDNLSVVFHLRPEARFHDGSPITAEDVIWTFNALKTDGRPIYRHYYNDVTNAAALDAHSVRFDFATDQNKELAQILGQLPVLSKRYYETHAFAETSLTPFLGSGPYRIGKFESNRFVELERVEDYWARDLPLRRGLHNFDRIRYDYFRDRSIAFEAFTSHQFDYWSENSASAWATAYDFPAREAGLVKKEEIRHYQPTGMSGLVFNLRRPIFQNPALREALDHAFDFEWSNRQLFYGQYARTKSYFSNSDLAATGKPSALELEYLEPLRGRIPDDVFGEAYQPPVTDGTGNIRKSLGNALTILKEAGYELRDGKLIDPKSGQPIAFEILLVQPNFERVVNPIVKNLARLGIVARVRTVDSAQYESRLNDYDFDVIAAGFPQSESPGNEQREFWGSAAADQPGSRNLIGIQDPAVDELIEKLIAAPDREHLVAASRALDRVLQQGHYLIPLFHITSDRIAYWNKFSHPEVTPRYGVAVIAWWYDADKAARLKASESSAR